MTSHTEHEAKSYYLTEYDIATIKAMAMTVTDCGKHKDKDVDKLMSHIGCSMDEINQDLKILETILKLIGKEIN